MLARDSRSQALLLRQPREAFPITIILPTQIHSLLRAGLINLSRDAPGSGGAVQSWNWFWALPVPQGAPTSVWPWSISLGSEWTGIVQWASRDASLAVSSALCWLQQGHIWHLGCQILIHLLFMLGGKPGVFPWLKNLEDQQNCKKVLALSLLFKCYFYLINYSLKETRNHCLKSCWDLL